MTVALNISTARGMLLQPDIAGRGIFALFDRNFHGRDGVDYYGFFHFFLYFTNAFTQK